MIGLREWLLSSLVGDDSSGLPTAAAAEGYSMATAVDGKPHRPDHPMTTGLTIR